MTTDPHSPRHAREHDGTFRMLIVCTGNICRSPLAEQLLRARLPGTIAGLEQGMIEVTSSGTVGLDGNRMDPTAIREAKRLGLAHAKAHRARPLVRDDIERADLVIGMAQEHRSTVVQMVPRAHRRAFTLIELTRTVESIAAGRSHLQLDPIGDEEVVPFLLRVVEAAQMRGLQPMLERDGLDIEDPYGRSPSVHRRSADAIAEHVDRLVVALRSLALGEAPPVAADSAGSPAA